MSTIRPDIFPKYREAGLKKNDNKGSTQQCLHDDNRLTTPQQIYKFRKSYKQQPAKTILHYGIVNDPLPPSHFTYGIQTQQSEGVDNIMKANRKQAQQKYKSIQKEPLGKPMQYHYKLPQQCKKDQFKYGLKTGKDKYDAKQTIFSGQNMPQQEPIHYDAGEQKKRDYNWKINPVDHRFGLAQKNIIHNEVKQVMSPQDWSDKYPQTKFIKTNQNYFMNRKHDKLGKVANLGQKQFPEDHVFGMKIQTNQWDAGKCLRGQPTDYDLRQDDDLGRSSKQGLLNIPRQGDSNRVFGVPTIRYDIKKPQKTSLADPNNYGQDQRAIDLLFPKQFLQYGLDDDDFDRERDKQQIREIFLNIGFTFKGNIFQTIFQRSKAIHGTILNRVSCRSFKRSLYEMCGINENNLI